MTNNRDSEQSHDEEISLPMEEDEDLEKSKTDQEQEDDLEKTRSEELMEAKKNKGKKINPRFTQLSEIVEKFNEYLKLGNKRKIVFYHLRKNDVAAYHYKRYKKIDLKVKKPRPIDSLAPIDLQCAELEMTTIANLREMYFNRPKILKGFEEIKTEKELTAKKLPGKKPSSTEVVSSTAVFKRYLDKYKRIKIDALLPKIPRIEIFKSEGSQIKEKYEEKKKSRDAIRNGYVVSVFNIDDDNLFTDNELFRIDKMRRAMSSSKEPRDEKEEVPSTEVWEWDELVNNLSKLSDTKDSSTTSESDNMAVEFDDVPIAYVEKRMKHYLLNWFQRESPPEEVEGTPGNFQFYERRYTRKYAFKTEKSRLRAAIKFLKLAKILYPQLECRKVLTELQSYIGPFTTDDLEEESGILEYALQRPKHRLRYFRKLLKETKELENMFVSKEIKTDSKDYFKEEDDALAPLKQREEKLKNNLENMHLSDIYDEYVDSCLPPPFNEIFVSIASGLIKYSLYIGKDPGTKELKKEMALLVARIMKLVLESMNWFINTIFRSGSPIDFSLEKESEETTVIESGEDGNTGKESENIIKKMMVNIIKYNNFNTLFANKDPDISSAEYQSTEEEKKTSKRNGKTKCIN